jgi:hypothetical protein
MDINGPRKPSAIKLSDLDYAMHSFTLDQENPASLKLEEEADLRDAIAGLQY